MIHIKNKNDFEKSLNEDLIDFLKKGFKQTFTYLSDNKRKTNADLIHKINNSKSFKYAINNVKNILSEYLNTNINNIESLKTILLDDLISFDIILKSLSKKFGINELLPINFYKDNNNKLLKTTMSYEKEIDFLKNLKTNSDQILIQLLKQSGIEEQEINNLLHIDTANNKLNELQDVQYLQNTDNLEQNDTLNDTQNDAQNDAQNENEIDYNKISETYTKFQKNNYKVLMDQLNTTNTKIEAEYKNPSKFL